MSQADIQYNKLIRQIMNHGHWDFGEDVRTVWADGTKAHTIGYWGYDLRFDNSEVPILTTKKVAWKTAIKELLWIWQMKSNVVQDLRDMNKSGTSIWDEWELEDGTIGRAYGYQLGKKCRVHPETNLYIDQVDYLLYSLVNNPASRRHVTTLWDKDDLDEMALTPCVWNTNWRVKGGKLHLKVGIRSNDMMLGNPFNVFQYHVLLQMVAQVTGYEVGEILFNIDDAHIYDRHIVGAIELLSRPMFRAPVLKINPEVTDFYDFTIDDFELEGYEYGEQIDFEVAI